jgi:uncharacterized damage-inducible protein DinB
MITPAYVRTMAAYNAEMNRRLYGAAARLSDAERRASRGAFWGSIHGTLTHILWGDRQWMSRFDDWPRPTVAIKESAGMIEDFATLRAERERADANISRWSTKLDEAWLAEEMAWFSGAAGDPLLQSSDPSSRPSARDADGRGPGNRRHRPVSADPPDHPVGGPYPAADTGQKPTPRGG